MSSTVNDISLHYDFCSGCWLLFSTISCTSNKYIRNKWFRLKVLPLGIWPAVDGVPHLHSLLIWSSLLKREQISLSCRLFQKMAKVLIVFMVTCSDSLLNFLRFENIAWAKLLTLHALTDYIKISILNWFCVL